MGFSRRNFIYSTGVTGLALIGSGGIFVVTRTPHNALAAWDKINDKAPVDIRLDVFRYAILAPNPHNRQPWIIKLIGTDEAIITCDLDRRLPETDPFDRQILIGFGCFLELTRIAAAERGFRLEISSLPNGLPSDRLDRRTIAHLRFIADASTPKDPLFAMISMRRTSKRPFDTTRPIDKTFLSDLTSHSSDRAQVKASNDTTLLKSLRAQTWEAWMVEVETTRTWMESVNLMRIGKAEIEANPDGISIGGTFLEALALTGQISRQQFATIGSTAYNSSVDRYRPIMATSMAYAWIITESNSRRDQLEAGRIYVRLNLEATRQGVGFHPVSQALQEYKEMAKSFELVKATLFAKTDFDTKADQRVQMLMRLGYSEAMPVTPRWPLENRLTGA